MNLVLLVADSLRADRLSCYGCPRPTSPALDALAGAGARFSEFFTCATPTEPAVTSLFTGQLPVTHGILSPRRRPRLARRAPWLPEVLAARGWDTAAVDDLAWRRHFGRGFAARLYRRAHDEEYVDGFTLNRLAIPWLRRRRRPFLLYVRYGDTHTPYWPAPRHRGRFYDGDPTRANAGSLDPFYARPLKGYLLTRWLEPAARAWPGAAGTRIEDLEWCRAQYDAAVRTLDDAVAELLDALARLGLADDTLVAVLGDHGESLGEHGIYFEHHGLYECTLRPPLILAWPGGIPGGVRVAARATTPDVAPTLLELAGVPRPPGMEGRSLARLLAGGAEASGREPVVACEATWLCKWAYRADGHKLIVAREPDPYGNPPVELYDLATDPGEVRNLADVRPDLRDALRAEFEAWLRGRLRAAGRPADPVAAHGSMRRELLRPPSARRRLKRALRAWWRGRRSGGGGAQARLRPDGAAAGQLERDVGPEGQGRDQGRAH